MTAAKIITVAALAALAYVYFGYPLLCALLAAARRRPVASAPGEPSVSILISARNEIRHIDATVRNKLALDYPADRLEVLVVSDGSDDGTDEAVAALADAEPGRVRLLRQDPRAGKTAALNMAVGEARGEILVFSDANSLYAPDALRELVAVFADPEVGYATGRMVYRAADGSLTGEGCSAYMRYENLLRRLETGVGSIVGVDGGIDAVRAGLYRPMRPDQLPDLVLPLQVAGAGRRVVFAPKALLYEDALAVAGDEFRMRVRVSLRAWHGLKDMAGLLNPFRHGVFSMQLFSHKWLRYLAPVIQAPLLIANLALLSEGGFWTILLACQGLFYLLAWAGHLARRRGMPSPLGLPYYLCLVNAAAGVAFLRFLRGDRLVVWQPRT